jgi:hypothetical protein
VKLGTENPKKVAVAVVLLLIGVFVLIRSFNASSPESMVASQAALQPLLGGKTLLSDNNLDPRLRLDLLKNAEGIEYKGNGRNIFRAGAEPQPEIPKPKTPPMPGTGPDAGNKPTTPPPPTINLKFFGFAIRQGAENKVFLADGDDVFVAGQGDIVNRRYKILHITLTSVEVEDVICNVRQTLNLTQG